ALRRGLWPSDAQVLRDDRESHPERALHEHRIAGPELRAQPFGGLRRRRDPLAAVLARELAHRDHVLDPELADEVANLAVRSRSAGPEFEHGAEDGDAAPVSRTDDEVLERGPHRDGVRVVTVVQQHAVAGQWTLLLPEL